MKERVPWHMDRQSRMIRISRGERIAWLLVGVVSLIYIIGVVARITGYWKGF